MVFKNCLKVSYKGLTRTIICDVHQRYDDVIKRVMEIFDLNNMDCNAVQLYDEKGSKFDKEVFEYFILLFPNPQKLFFIRLDTSKLTNYPLANVSNHEFISSRAAFAPSKSVNIIKDDNNSINANSDAAPVMRQNCFIGQWPGHNTNSLQSLQSGNHQDIVRGIVKRIHKLQDSHRKTKNISTPTIVKRSMRF